MSLAHAERQADSGTVVEDGCGRESSPCRPCVSLHLITDAQNEDLSFKLKPSAAGEIQVDAAGRWRVTLRVGMDLRPGAYKLATGAHPPVLNLFDVYLQVK